MFLNISTILSVISTESLLPPSILEQQQNLSLFDLHMTVFKIHLNLEFKDYHFTKAYNNLYNLTPAYLSNHSPLPIS